MPFDSKPRLFIEEIILAYPEGMNGVYGLRSPFRWIYVGKGDIRAELLAHLETPNSCMLREEPTSWYADIVKGDPSARQNELILELRPVCNQRPGPSVSIEEK